MSSNYNLYVRSGNNVKDSPLSLNEVKEFLNIDINFSDHDNLLTNLLNMATEYAEWYTEKSFMKQDWRVICVGCLPRRLYLPFGPVINVKEIKLESGEVLINNSYSVETIGNYVEFKFLGYYGKTEVIYTAGHESKEEVPGALQEGILQHVSYAYNNRDSSQFMLGVKKLYDQFRELKLTL